MIAERRSLLLQSTEFVSPSPHVQPAVQSLSQRLQALSTSSEGWKRRVSKESAGTPSRPKKDRSRPVAHKINMEDGLSSFFSRQAQADNGEYSLADLDSVTCTKLLPLQRSRVSPPKRSSSQPQPLPLRPLTLDIQFTKPEIDEQDDLPQFGVSEGLDEPVAKSARRGLAAVEDYTAVREGLRREGSGGRGDGEGGTILVQVRGEERMDVRLVSAQRSSVHEKASFVAVTSDRVLIMHGEQSTVMERSKALEIATNLLHTNHIQSTATKVERASKGESAHRAFMDLLQGDERVEEEGEEMTSYEERMAQHNHFISVKEDLEAVLEMKGVFPHYSMLQPDKCMILDFFTDMYVWYGRKAKRSQVKCASSYALQLKCHRPSCVLIRTLSQGMQDILFASKFVDWPCVRLSSCTPSHNVRTPSRQSQLAYEFKCKKLTVEEAVEEVRTKHSSFNDDIVLEEMALNGTQSRVITEAKTFWSLQGEELKEMEETNTFSTFKCYVLKWEYRVEVGGVRRLATGECSEREHGRTRVAYFYWLGGAAHIKDHGLCALRLSQMDKEKRPHVRMEEGSECGAFLALFKGVWTVARGDEWEEGERLIVLGREGGRSRAYHVEADELYRGNGVYLVKEGGGRVRMLAAAHSSIHDITAALSIARSRGEKVVEEVEGDDVSVQWMPLSTTRPPRVFYVLNDGLAEVQPSKPGTTFPYSQSCLKDDSSLFIYGGSRSWLWNDCTPSHNVLRHAKQFSDALSTVTSVTKKGEEPAELQSIFPHWTPSFPSSSPTSCRSLDELMRESQSPISLDRLRSRTSLPQGIDLGRLEQYLDDEDFLRTFSMSRQSFDSLPQWKQIRLRKDSGLF